MTSNPIVLILGSAPDATRAASWPKPEGCKIVAVNNAWRLREDWDVNIYPDDFPEENRPPSVADGQEVITSETYVPANNHYGGIVYAGATMAFTAGYWALRALKPRVLAYLGCDMVYSGSNTHFYGQGTPDPLRDDVTLRSLEAKSARLMALAAGQNCACVNLSEQPHSRLVFPRVAYSDLAAHIPLPRGNQDATDQALRLENQANYVVSHGRYWESDLSFDQAVMAEIDKHWLAAVTP